MLKTVIERKRVRAQGVWAVLLVLVCALCGVLVCSCSSDDASNTTEDVAAKINNEDLYVSRLTNYLDSMYEMNDCKSEDDLVSHLQAIGYTPDEYWQYLIDNYGAQLAVVDKAKELGISLSGQELDDYIAETKASLFEEIEAEEGSKEADRAWESHCLAYGGEDNLRDEMEYQLYYAKLCDQAVEYPELSDEQVHDYIDRLIGSYASPRVSVICFDSEEEAQRVLDEMLADPDPDFTAYFDQYNTDDDLKKTEGDLGWTLTSSMDMSLHTALERPLNKMDVGSIYDKVIQVGDKYYIAKETEYYDGTPADGEAHVDYAAMPQEIYDYAVENATDAEWSSRCGDYKQQLYQDANVDILIPSYYDVKGQNH